MEKGKNDSKQLNLKFILRGFGIGFMIYCLFHEPIIEERTISKQSEYKVQFPKLIGTFKSFFVDNQKLSSSKFIGEEGIFKIGDKIPVGLYNYKSAYWYSNPGVCEQYKGERYKCVQGQIIEENQKYPDQVKLIYGKTYFQQFLDLFGKTN